MKGTGADNISFNTASHVVNEAAILIVQHYQGGFTFSFMIKLIHKVREKSWLLTL